MDWLDTARGFAILLVFWGHIASRSSLLKNAIYCFSAPLFIFVSGYLFRIRPGETFWAFAKRKAKSIILPCTALCVVIILFSAAWERSTAPFRLVKQLFLQIRSWPVWYMTCLYFLNLFMFLLVRITERLDRTKTRIVVVAVNVALVLLGWAFYHIPVFATLPWNEGITALPWNIDIAVMAFPFFCVAYYSAKNGWIDNLSEAILSKVHNRWYLYELICLAAVCVSSAIGLFSGRLCGMNWSLDMYYDEYAFVPLTYLSGIMGAFFVCLAWRPYPVRILQRIGKHSIIYFAWHLQIYFPIILKLLQPLAIPQGWKNILHLVLACLMSEAVYLLLEYTGAGVVFGIKKPDKEKMVQIGKYRIRQQRAAIAAVLAVCVLAAGGYGLKKIYGHEHQMNSRLGEIKAATDRIPEMADALNKGEEPGWIAMHEGLYRTICDAVADGRETNAFTALASGKDISILFVGDSIGAMEWTEPAVKWIEYQYGVSCQAKNICMGGSTSYAGYTRVHLLEEDEHFDLAVICFGQNDSPEDFALYYETVIRSLLERNPNCSLISILESSQRAYTDKINEIIRLADYYSIPTVDTIAAYGESEYSYEVLSPDTVHPGPLGREIYIDAFKQTLSEEVEKAMQAIADSVPELLSGNMEAREAAAPSRVHERTVPADPRVSEMVQFSYLPAEQFTRVDDCTFSIETEARHGMPGIYYWVVPGHNGFKIYENDRLLYEDTEEFYHYFMQENIHLLDTESITVEGNITVVFDSLDQAEGFRGLIFSNPES